jgi:hypothetical protein
MSGKPRQANRQTVPDGSAGNAALQSIDGQLVIVAMTPAVARLARIARTIAKERSDPSKLAEPSCPDRGGPAR